MNEWTMLAIGLVLTVGTGLFVAAEFSLVNLDRAELEKREAQGERRLGLTIAALRITSTHLSSAQLGITLTTLLSGYTFEPAISSLLQAPLTSVGLPESLVPGVGAVVGIMVATLLSMVIGELVPKNFALALPLATAKVVMPFQTAFTTVFKPLVLLLNNAANGLIRRMGIEPKEELSSARSAEELSYVIQHSATAGMLEPNDATLLSRTLRFSTHDAAELMTPRVHMASVSATDNASDIIAVSRATGFSRFPVTGDGPDDIQGVVHVKQAFAVALDARTATLATQLMIEPIRVPESQPAPLLLTVLRGAGFQLAVVTDEYGGTAGVVTIEDLMEEIVGELEDEHDHTHIALAQRGRSFTFSAQWRPDELLERTGVSVPPDGDWDTLAGFVAAELGRIPELGDEVAIAEGTLRVDRTDGARTVRLQFVPRPTPDPVDGADIGASSDE